MTDERELLPCPFCGSDAISKQKSEYGYWHVVCCDCGSSTSISSDEPKVTGRWNTRAALDQRQVREDVQRGGVVTDEMVEQACQIFFVGDVRKPWPWRETVDMDEPDMVFKGMRDALQSVAMPVSVPNSEEVGLALQYSRNYAKASPYLTKTTIEHIEGLCDLLERQSIAAAPSHKEDG